jgi:hypothetical protein
LQLFYRIHEHARVLLRRPASSLTDEESSQEEAEAYLSSYAGFLRRLNRLAFQSLAFDLAAEKRAYFVENARKLAAEEDDDQVVDGGEEEPPLFARRITALGLVELLYLPEAITEGTGNVAFVGGMSISFLFIIRLLNCPITIKKSPKIYTLKIFLRLIFFCKR